jgi:hypothetical protein
MVKDDAKKMAKEFQTIIADPLSDPKYLFYLSTCFTYSATMEISLFKLLQKPTLQSLSKTCG